MAEPPKIKLTADESFCKRHGLNNGGIYDTKFQNRDYDDDSKIVYVFDPVDTNPNPNKRRLIVLTQTEYSVVSYS